MSAAPEDFKHKKDVPQKIESTIKSAPDLSVLDCLDCPVCKGEPKGGMTTVSCCGQSLCMGCKSGIAATKNDKSKLPCPFCRTPFDNTKQNRNLALEALMQSIRTGKFTGSLLTEINALETSLLTAKGALKERTEACAKAIQTEKDSIKAARTEGIEQCGIHHSIIAGNLTDLQKKLRERKAGKEALQNDIQRMQAELDSRNAHETEESIKSMNKKSIQKLREDNEKLKSEKARLQKTLKSLSKSIAAVEATAAKSIATVEATAAKTDAAAEAAAASTTVQTEIDETFLGSFNEMPLCFSEEIREKTFISHLATYLNSNVSSIEWESGVVLVFSKKKNDKGGIVLNSGQIRLLKGDLKSKSINSHHFIALEKQCCFNTEYAVLFQGVPENHLNREQIYKKTYIEVIITVIYDISLNFIDRPLYQPNGTMPNEMRSHNDALSLVQTTFRGATALASSISGELTGSSSATTAVAASSTGNTVDKAAALKFKMEFIKELMNQLDSTLYHDEWEHNIKISFPPYQEKMHGLLDEGLLQVMQIYLKKKEKSKKCFAKRMIEGNCLLISVNDESSTKKLNPDNEKNPETVLAIKEYAPLSLCFITRPLHEDTLRAGDPFDIATLALKLEKEKLEQEKLKKEHSDSANINRNEGLKRFLNRLTSLPPANGVGFVPLSGPEALSPLIEQKKKEFFTNFLRAANPLQPKLPSAEAMKFSEQFACASANYQPLPFDRTQQIDFLGKLVKQLKRQVKPLQWQNGLTLVFTSYKKENPTEGVKLDFELIRELIDRLNANDGSAASPRKEILVQLENKNVPNHLFIYEAQENEKEIARDPDPHTTTIIKIIDYRKVTLSFQEPAPVKNTPSSPK